ncbi:MAG: hypothetical protein ACK47F_07195 [Flavobacteriales bacterium]
MHTPAHLFEISEIAFLTFANEITLRGTIHRGTLHYETELCLNSSQLNKVINALQHLNPEADITGSFIDQHDGYGNTVYFFYGDQLDQRIIALDHLSELKEIKRIRA